MDEQGIYKDMYYYLCSKVCNVIEQAKTLTEAKETLIKATQRTEKMYMELGTEKSKAL